MSRLRLTLAVLLLTCALSTPAAAQPPAAEAKTHCAVCGMFVQRHPDWLAVLELEGAPPQFFCGPKDLLKFLHFPERFSPQLSRRQVRAVHVKDYYSLRVIDGRRAFYVTGSDVRGPMGEDLIPFSRREDGEEFLQDHDGRRLLPFDQITPELLRELE